METIKELNFASPTFKERIKGMLGVDFYRLFHTPLFYVFLLIAAIIPAMVSCLTMMPDQNGNVMEPLYTNVWQIIASIKPLYVVNTISDYANMNMVFIFGGIMVSIFIGHDYKSGYVKQLFTTHPKKEDYMISKTIISAFSMACMCITYFIGGTIGGLIAGYETSVNFGSLLVAIFGKIILSLGWASLFTFLNVIFRRYFGFSVFASFFFGTGILIIGVGAIFNALNIPSVILNVFLYGASVNACLSSGFGAFITAIIVSIAWTGIYVILGSHVLNKSDVY